MKQYIHARNHYNVLVLRQNWEDGAERDTRATCPRCISWSGWLLSGRRYTERSIPTVTKHSIMSQNDG